MILAYLPVWKSVNLFDACLATSLDKLFINFKSSDSYAQKTLISIDVHNQRVEDILKEIEEQSDFDFFFNNKHVDLNRRVSISVDRSNIFSVLKEVFAGTNVRYSVLDKKIILSVEVQSPQ